MDMARERGGEGRGNPEGENYDDGMICHDASAPEGSMGEWDA